MMTLYNVLVPVVELVDAADRPAAIDALSARLTRAGFEVYVDRDASDAFESEA